MPSPIQFQLRFRWSFGISLPVCPLFAGVRDGEIPCVRGVILCICLYICQPACFTLRSLCQRAGGPIKETRADRLALARRFRPCRRFQAVRPSGQHGHLADIGHQDKQPSGQHGHLANIGHLDNTAQLDNTIWKVSRSLDNLKKSGKSRGPPLSLMGSFAQHRPSATVLKMIRWSKMCCVR